MVASNNITTSENKNEVRWIIEVNDLHKQHPEESKYEDRYSIVRKSYQDQNLIESQSILVTRKNLFQIKDKIDFVLNECM